MNRLKTAMDRLATRISDCASEDVTYCRPGVGRIPVRAGFAQRIESSVSSAGVDIRTKHPDFLIRAKDLVLGGVFLVPRRGDEIVYTNAMGVETVYAVNGITAVDATRFGIQYRIPTVAVRFDDSHMEH